MGVDAKSRVQAINAGKYTNTSDYQAYVDFLADKDRGAALDVDRLITICVVSPRLLVVVRTADGYSPSDSEGTEYPYCSILNDGDRFKIGPALYDSTGRLLGSNRDKPLYVFEDDSMAHVTPLFQQVLASVTSRDVIIFHSSDDHWDAKIANNRANLSVPHVHFTRIGRPASLLTAPLSRVPWPENSLRYTQQGVFFTTSKLTTDRQQITPIVCINQFPDLNYPQDAINAFHFKNRTYENLGIHSSLYPAKYSADHHVQVLKDKVLFTSQPAYTSSLHASPGLFFYCKFISWSNALTLFLYTPPPLRACYLLSLLRAYVVLVSCVAVWWRSPTCPTLPQLICLRNATRRFS
jgi:hypothetical protein